MNSLQKHQQRTKGSKDLLKRLKDENTCLLVQLSEKDEEIDRLQEEVADDAHLKTQLEEAKRVEEVLKDQLDEKDKACQKLEMEVVELRKKAEHSEAHVKTSSSILDEILESQRSPFNKTVLAMARQRRKLKKAHHVPCLLFLYLHKRKKR